jgi:hypothetical protein
MGLSCPYAPRAGAGYTASHIGTAAPNGIGTAPQARQGLQGHSMTDAPRKPIL